MKTRSPPFAFLGTGFVVDDGTLIATCAHVVPDTPKSEAGAVLTVVVNVSGTSEPQAREVTALVLDVEHDLALLRIAGAPLPALKLGNSDSVREGQSIAFTGFPLGPVLGFHAVTHNGIVASLAPVTLPARNAKQLEGQQIERLRAGPVTLFQLDATVYSGNSGSPIYDPNTGEVLAVVSMGFLRGIKDPVLGQPANISFAVPTKYLRELIARLPR
jgi:S1-C subfamily serine protease